MEDAVSRKFFHPSKNAFSLALLTPNSNRKTWFLCDLQHEWSVRFSSFVAAEKKCPYCAGRRTLVGFNDFATRHPSIASEWHPTKNSTSDIPANLSISSKQPVWWVCPQGHDWKSSPAARGLQHKKCSYCSGSSKSVLPGVNDLLSQNPDLATEWHPTKNSRLPEQVTLGSSYQAWWMCTKGHEWHTAVSNRSRKKSPSGCPDCQGSRVQAGVNDIRTKRPELVALLACAEKDARLSAYSTKVVNWVEPCGHQYAASVARRAKAKECLACTHRVIIAGANDLATVNPTLAAEWHPTKNSDLTPADVSVGKNINAWWVCALGHEWKASINDRHGQQTGCPYCKNRKVLHGFNDLLTTHPAVASTWHPTKNEGVTPEDVTYGSDVQAWWQCAKGHEWCAGVHQRTRTQCPVCSRKRWARGVNDLATVNPTLAAEWHPTKNGSRTAGEVTAYHNHAVWCKCANGHEWSASVGGRMQGRGCRKCVSASQASAAESKIAEFIQKSGAVILQHDRSILDRGQELDIYIPSKQVAIEFNGLYWHSDRFRPQDAQSRHYDKWVACKEKGIQLIQIWEDEWSRNPEQVKKMLAHKLGIQLPGEKRVMARETQVVEVTKVKAEAFLNENHVQGYAAGSYYLGLVEPGGTKTLLAVLVLKKEAGTEGKTLNIIRYATSATVSGGFTKLLKHAERVYEPEAFITFSDHCVSDGGLYRNNGFVADKELPPDYMYVVRNERKHKFGYRLKRFRDDPNLQYQEGLTERELAQLNGLPRIWDAGKTRWRKPVCFTQ